MRICTFVTGVKSCTRLIVYCGCVFGSRNHYQRYHWERCDNSPILKSMKSIITSENSFTCLKIRFLILVLRSYENRLNNKKNIGILNFLDSWWNDRHIWFTWQRPKAKHTNTTKKRHSQTTTHKHTNYNYLLFYFVYLLLAVS